MSLLTEELTEALHRSDQRAVVRVLETVFRTGSAGARERIEGLLAAEQLATDGGVMRAQRLLSTLFYETKCFDAVVGPEADPSWLEALAPIAEHAALFHMATLYLTPFRGPRAVEVLLRLLEHLRLPGIGASGPALGLIDSLRRRTDARTAPVIASLLGAPSADDWLMCYALKVLDDPSTAAALRAYQPRMKKKKHRVFAEEVLAHLARDRTTDPRPDVSG